MRIPKVKMMCPIMWGAVTPEWLEKIRVEVDASSATMNQHACKKAMGHLGKCRCECGTRRK